eukprot:GHVH01015480.1.p1 GENE.GHVH01015480.1~~GHVH01015480.1.p1  ORF type:complete len:442 (+),score=43.26 GHVH01015480.1:106-1326(+)
MGDSDDDTPNSVRVTNDSSRAQQSNNSLLPGVPKVESLTTSDQEDELLQTSLSFESNFTSDGLYRPRGALENGSTTCCSEDMNSILPKISSSNIQAELDIDDQDIDDKKAHYHTPAFWTALGFMCLVGAINLMVSKAAYLQESFPCSPFETCEEVYYRGFLGISMSKYVWQAIMGAFLYWGLDRKILKTPFFSEADDISATKMFDKKSMMKMLFISSIIDTTFTLCERSAISFTRASVVAALSTTQILVATAGDLFIGKRAIMQGESIGLFIILSGLVVFSSEAIFGDRNAGQQGTKPILGASLAVLANVARAVHSSYQGLIMVKYRVPPMKIITIESVFGIAIVSVFAIILNLAGVEDSKSEFWLTMRNWKVLALTQSFAFMCIGFNGSTAYVGRYVYLLSYISI